MLTVDVWQSNWASQLEGMTLAERLYFWGRDDLDHLARPILHVHPPILLRCLFRYPLTVSSEFWTREFPNRDDCAGIPPLLADFVLREPLWRGHPRAVEMFLLLIGITRDELQRLHDGLFPPDAAAWCPLCTGPVIRAIDVVYRRAWWGDESRCGWCRKLVKPVVWSAFTTNQEVEVSRE